MITRYITTKWKNVVDYVNNKNKKIELGEFYNAMEDDTVTGYKVWFSTQTNKIKNY